MGFGLYEKPAQGLVVKTLVTSKRSLLKGQATGTGSGCINMSKA